MVCIRHLRRAASGDVAWVWRCGCAATLALVLGAGAVWGQGTPAAATQVAIATVTAERLAGARQERRLDIATSAPAPEFKRFLAAFKQKYPFIDVDTGFRSSPAPNIAADVQTQIAAKHVTLDVIHTANLADFVRLAREHRLLRFDSPEYEHFPRSAQNPGYWVPARAIGVVMVYNKKLLQQSETPRAWSDLLRPEFAGHKIAIKNSDAGTLFNQLYSLDQQYDGSFSTRLAAQNPVVLSLEGILSAVKNGSVRVGATVDHWRAFTPETVEAGIVPIFPRDGMPLVLAPIAILADSPHPNAAKLFVDFMLSKEGQQFLNSDIFGTYSMRPDVLPSLDQPPLGDTRPLLPTDMDDYVRARDGFDERFKSLFR